MRIAEVIGTVTLSRSIPEFDGATLKLVQPLSRAALAGNEKPASDTLVGWDEFGAGMNCLVGISEGGEAAQPFRPVMKPVDTYCALIIDQLDID